MVKPGYESVLTPDQNSASLHSANPPQLGQLISLLYELQSFLPANVENIIFSEAGVTTRAVVLSEPQGTSGRLEIFLTAVTGQGHYWHGVGSDQGCS